MRQSEYQVWESIKYGNRERQYVGDRVDLTRKKLGGGIFTTTKKQICDFWLFCNGFFCGVEVKDTAGEEFNASQNARIKFQLMNLRNIERYGQRLQSGRGYFLIQFILLDSVEWWALRVSWMDGYFQRKNTHVIQLDEIKLANDPLVIKMIPQRVTNVKVGILDLRLLAEGENNGSDA